MKIIDGVSLVSCSKLTHYQIKLFQRGFKLADTKKSQDMISLLFPRLSSLMTRRAKNENEKIPNDGVKLTLEICSNAKEKIKKKLIKVQVQTFDVGNWSLSFLEARL